MRIAQSAMRHSDPKLTANVYTDPTLLDIGGALDVLPKLPLDGDPEPLREAATGTAGHPEGLAPMLAPTLGDSGPFETTPDKTAGGGDGAGSPTGDGVSGGGVKRRLPPSAGDEGSELVGVIGFEPTTSCSQSRHSSQAELHPDEFPGNYLRNIVVPRLHRQEQSRCGSL